MSNFIKSNDLKVSVCMITYNHASYIAQAIESILSQKTSFTFELVIAEDHSTDNTWTICMEYAKKYPNVIRLLPKPPSGNIGMMKNFSRSLLACKAEYIALCEGDDYWTNDLKLEKQYQLLQSNQEIAFCFHKGDTMVETLKELKAAPDYPRQMYTFKDFAAYGCLAKTMSVFFRNSEEIKRNFNEAWVLALSGADQLLYLLLLKNGQKALAVNESWGVYRQHQGGIWSSQTNLSRANSIVKDIFLYKRYLQLNPLQEAFLDWQLKKALSVHLMNKINFSPKLVSRGLRMFINRGLFFSGPGRVSSLIARGLFTYLVRNSKAD